MTMTMKWSKLLSIKPLLNKNLGGRGEKIQLLFPQMVMSRLGEHMIDMAQYGTILTMPVERDVLARSSLLRNLALQCIAVMHIARGTRNIGPTCSYAPAPCILAFRRTGDTFR